MVPNISSRFSPKYIPIAWILVGLMVGGSLFDYLATRHLPGFCIEQRLEQEDDRSDLSDLFYVPTQTNWCMSSPRLADVLIEVPKLNIRSAHQAARFERGPPSLVSAVV